MKDREMKKMKMPKTRMAEQEAEMDMGMLGEELGMMDGESMSDMEEQSAEIGSAPMDLELLADEELLAEVKKRGLSLADMPEEEAEEDMAAEDMEAEDEESLV